MYYELFHVHVRSNSCALFLFDNYRTVLECYQSISWLKFTQCVGDTMLPSTNLSDALPLDFSNHVFPSLITLCCPFVVGEIKTVSSVIVKTYTKFVSAITKKRENNICAGKCLTQILKNDFLPFGSARKSTCTFP